MSNTSSSSSSSTVVMKDVIYKIQLRLLEGIKSEAQLLVASSLLSKPDYHDVVTERSITQMCGYPLCTNSLLSSEPSNKGGRYHISLKEHKVYDLSETRMYCSTKCVVNSRAYAESLLDERLLELDRRKVDKIMREFEGLSVEGEIKENGDFGLGKLVIKEKENTSGNVGIVSMEEWIGPSNAIEGYVPQHDRNRPSGSKSKDLKLKKEGKKREEENIFNEMDFMSTIITQEDGYSISKKPSTQTKKKINRKGTKDKLTISDGSSLNVQNIPEPILNGVDVNASEAEPSCSGLRSSLKSSGGIKSNRSVTWADEKTYGADNQTVSEVNRTENKNDNEKNKGVSITEEESIDDGDHAFRLASAEACAEALIKAAEAVASGEADVPDAVSEAGIVILPPPVDDNKAISEGAVDPEPAPVKWPMKTGIVESDFLDNEDSWFDSPPEEFVVDLSPFATMFMSLFAWVSSSTLAYVYGRDDSFHEEYASVNGREYPRKIVLSDGRSSEIRQTLAGCLSRALPGLVHDLRLPTPVSTIEFGMGGLLETMSFLDPLPGLRMKQWQVFILLFIEALSVCRIPAIAPHLTNRRSFFQKVFDDGRISSEEYEVLKDLILPLGRVPQFSKQSGA